MNKVEDFLETSTIHGLIHISRNRKYAKLIWILVVIGGFTLASIMIQESFQTWADDPIKTTIESKSIKELHFPKLTVCPPKKTYTNLNFDIMKVENMTLDNKTRIGLKNIFLDYILNVTHQTVMNKINRIQDSNLYYNWYHGYTKIDVLPVKQYNKILNDEVLSVVTSSTFGSISTSNFGKAFNADKVEPKYGGKC